MRKNQNGIGLLPFLLVLVIITIASLVAVKYYQGVRKGVKYHGVALLKVSEN